MRLVLRIRDFAVRRGDECQGFLQRVLSDWAPPEGRVAAETYLT